MKGFLALLLAMGIIVALGDAYCFMKKNTARESVKGCILDGKLYPYGEIERTEECFSCTCNQDSIHCCSLFHIPIGFNKERCKLVFNKERCDYDVVQKDDPSKKCSTHSRVG